jgi:hypothetical protein
VKTPDDRRKELPWLTDNSIPAANPADLKTLWKLQNDLEKQYGWQGVIMGIGFDRVRQRNAPSASEARVMKWGNERTAHA